jgi:hypothetical protein
LKSLPGHYLGSVANYAADTPWDLEYSLVLDALGHYQFFSRDGEGLIRQRNAGTSGRAFAQFAVQNGFDVEELLRDLSYIDSGFAADFKKFIASRNATD